MDEFRRHQRLLRRRGRSKPAPGFPDGPWGDYEPFVHPATGRTFHARDAFDAAALGFSFDRLPVRPKAQMRAPPQYAVFRDISPYLPISRHISSYLVMSAHISSYLPISPRPRYAVFRDISVLRMETPRLVHVFVHDASKGVWAPPAGLTPDTVARAEGYAGAGSIFFFALEQAGHVHLHVTAM